MAALVISVGKPKGMPSKLKDPMKGADEPEKDDAPAEEDAEGSDFEASVREAFDALKSDDRETGIQALSAAITAKVADLMAEKG